MIPRKVAIQLRDARILVDGRLRDAKTSWGKPMLPSFLHEQLKTTERIGFEWALFWACKELNIPVFPHPEIYAMWKQGHLNESRFYAAVHPDKFLDVVDESIHAECTTTHARASSIYLEAIFCS